MSTNEIGKRLRNARLNKKYTQAYVANLLGCTYQAISNYERGTTRVDADTLLRLCSIYGITTFDLMRSSAWDYSMFAEYRKAKTPDDKKRYFEMWGVPSELMDEYNELRETDYAPTITEDTITFPVLVDVAAGYDRPAQMLQNWEGQKIEVPRAFLHGRNPDDYFAMRVVGDSMYPDYQDGDVLLVLRQATYDYSGQVCVVLYDGEDATLKRVECVPGEWMKLLPINPQYPPRTISGVDLEQCRIIGLPKILVRDIK